MTVFRLDLNVKKVIIQYL